MIQLKRTRRSRLKLFKKEIANSLGGRIKFKEIYPYPSQRLALYEALLFERKIDGGIENQAILNKYNALIN